MSSHLLLRRIWLDAPEGRLAETATMLGADERERAARFVDHRAARRYVLAHAALHRLLGRVLDRDPHDVRIEYGPWGRPLLEPAATRQLVTFSLAYAGDRALLAVAVGARVGVDAEPLESLVRVERAMDVAFSARERDRIAELAATGRPAALRLALRTWTCKEAFLKATGSGFARPPATVEIAIAARGRAQLLATGDEALDPTDCQLRELRPWQDCVGAVALLPCDAASPIAAGRAELVESR